MRTVPALAATLSACALAWAVVPSAPRMTDAQLVEEACNDYVIGIYEAEPERIDRSVHPDLRKAGFWRTDGAAEYPPMAEMTFDELRHLTEILKAGGHVPANPPREIKVFEVADQTACAKVVGFWGQDYVHLAKFDGRWQIVNIIWQSPPTN
ncbi:MAG: nuclear transport factor 2 family protein [Phycisphaerales bacterium]|jgi:hypothetical protein|nr:nuclear transport factor 2 family protein [Phycisphaerales bacterium]